MYQNIFVDKKNGTVYLWDDKNGLVKFPLSKISYAYRRKTGGSYKSLYGDELEKITMSGYNPDPDLFESDIQPELRTLLDLYSDSDDPSTGHKIVVIDIETDSSGGFPNIEKGDKAITAIAMYDQAEDKYYSFILDPDKKIENSEVDNVITRSFQNEESLLGAFLNKWNEINPTIVTGWNVALFDCPCLFNRIRAVLGKDASYRLSPIKIAYQNKFNRKMTIAGVSCLDYIDLYKKFLGVMKSSYSLANVAKDEELKTQKMTYRGNLNDLYKNDIHRFVEYNLVDVKVVVELDKKYDFIYLARSVCHKGHVPYEWFQMSSRWIDGAILNYVHKVRKQIAPNKPSGGREEYEKMEKENEDGFIGAYVKEPIPGLYDWVCSADITSLYPSLIMSLNISIETKVSKISNWDKIKFDNNEISLVEMENEAYSAVDFRKMIKDYAFSISSNGVIYRQNVEGVVPVILRTWFDERVEYRKLAKKYSDEKNKEKEDFYNRRQLRQKIFLNSIYGCLGLPVSRWYDRDNAEAVTVSGQFVIKGSEKVVNDYINTKTNSNVDNIIYVDTDSNYFSTSALIKSNNISDAKALQFSIDVNTEICNKINRFYEYMVPKIFNVDPKNNRIKIVPDVVAKKALWVAKKRYAMLKVYDMEKMKPVKDKNGNEGKLEVKGIDAVRSSFPAAFRKMAGSILDQLLRGISRDELDEQIMKFEESIDSHSIIDLAKTSSVKFISKSGEDNYDPRGRRLFQFVNKTPAQVKAALAYNDFLIVWKLDKQVEKIYSGNKVKWVHLLPNDFCVDTLALKADDTDPDRILEFIEHHIDRKKMYDRELHSKLKEIWNVIGWKYPSRGSQLSEGTFDFGEEW